MEELEMTSNTARVRGWAIGLVGAALAAALMAAVPMPGLFASAERGRVVPPPAADVTADDATTQVAVFAGGCFWGVQGVYQHVTGVTGAVSGYAGGSKASAHYEAVGRGDSGHAEAVQVTYDPRQVSYGALLQIFFSVAHDPTELNRQGPDVGPQYRSTIFPTGAKQAAVARAYIAQLNAAATFAAPIATTVEPDRAFYPAEDYHQDYLTLHPNQPYIAINDLPKIAELKRLFPGRYRDAPVLVRPGRAAASR
jgi:peptide-methionine (S)-S-oxide reductase